MTALIARIVGLLGALAAAVGLAALFVAPELPGLRTLALMALVGLGSWLYLDWPALSRWAASHGGMESARAGLLILVGAGIAIAAVVLVERQPLRWDLTPQKQHSVQPRTAEVLTSLAGAPIEVLGFFGLGTDPIAARHRARWQALASAFADAGPTLQVETFDPDVSRRRADLEGVTSNGVVIVRRGDRAERIYAPDENSLLHAIVRVANARDRGVYVSTGHGERSTTDITSTSLTDLQAELAALGLAVQPLDLTRSDVPSDAAVVLVVDPTVPLAAPSIARLDVFLNRNGGLFVAGEPGSETGLDALLQTAGLGLGPGLVVDPLVRSVTGDASTPMVARYGMHASVRDLRAPAILLGASPVVRVEHDPLAATVHTLALTSDLAWAESQPAAEPVTQGDGDLAGPLALLALGERHPEGKSAGTIVLSGDADWLSNDGLQSAPNRDLVVRILGTLAQQDDLIALPPRPPLEGSLAMDWLAQVIVGLLALVVLPGGCLAVATGLWLRRRVAA
ncbi:MAG: Gldg family protein [Deltaproteobacteria bacterium]|nr:Gldg family protein [Deltaproteobacteria bacterium]